MSESSRWFQQFQVEPDERTDLDAVWDDGLNGPRPVRVPTRAEKLSIVLVGVTAIGFIVLMAVTLLVAVYLSRR